MLHFIPAIALVCGAAKAEPTYDGAQAWDWNAKDLSQPLESFQTIEHIKNVGIYCWDPSGLPHKQFADVTVTDVLQGLQQSDCQPNRLVPLDSIPPTTFRTDLPDNKVMNEFPKDPGDIVPLYVAKRRGVDLQTVEFQLGGSALNALATRRIDQPGDKYLVQRCPTTGIIILSRSNKYEQNYAERSFQFKRILAGRDMADGPDQMKFESLRLMKVAGYSALIAADVHMVDDSVTPVEVKTGDPQHFGLKVMFQMLSVGAKALVMPKPHRPAFQKVMARTIEEVVGDHSPAELAIAERNIREALDFLKRSPEITADAPAELDLSGGTLRLKPCPPACGGDDLLPSAMVVEELLGRAAVVQQADFEQAHARMATDEAAARAARVTAAMRKAPGIVRIQGPAQMAVASTAEIIPATFDVSRHTFLAGTGVFAYVCAVLLLLSRRACRHGPRSAATSAGAPLLAADRNVRSSHERGLCSM